MKWNRNYSEHRRWAKRTLVRKYGAICQLCHLPFASMKDITIDHIVPKSEGGQDIQENYQLAHEGCNRAKASMSMEDYMLLQNGYLVS